MTDPDVPSARSRWPRAQAFSCKEAVNTYTENAKRTLFVGSEPVVFRRYFDAGDGRVLDLGCGAGRTTGRLADRGFDVVGVDVSRPMLNAARELHPSIEFRLGNAADLDFADESFDYVLFSANGIDYLHPECERDTVFEEVRRVLVPGGLFAFSSHNLLYNAPAALRDWTYLRNFYLENGNVRRLLDRYKVDGRVYDVETYVSDPFTQRRQVEDAGFEFVKYVGKRPRPVSYFERSPYYVARKPEA